MRWTLQEEIRLILIARTHFYALLNAGWINADSAISHTMHADFNSEHRDPAALLYKLKEAGVLKFATKPTQSPFFICKITDDKPLYDFSSCPRLLNKPLHPATLATALERFNKLSPTLPLDKCIAHIASELQLEAMQVEKILFEQGCLTMNNARQYVTTQSSGPNSLADIIHEQSPTQAQIDAIDRLRAKASRLYHVHEREGAEIIFSSDGTGFGKSYGVIDGYARYLEKRTSETAPTACTDRGFNNLLFMSPHKSQIDLAHTHKQRIVAAGGEFICVLARIDIFDLDFIDWATGQTNRDRYLAWCKKAANSSRIKSNLQTLKACIEGIDYDHKRLHELRYSGNPDQEEERELIEDNLAKKQRMLINTIQSACESLLKQGDPRELIPDFIERGLAARHKTQLNNKRVPHASSASCDEVYLEIIKQVLPFEVCLYLPCVLLMTTNKFDTSTKQVRPKLRGEGNRFVDVPVDHIVGSKERLQDPMISTLSNASHQQQVDYLRDEHFKMNAACRFRERDIRFNIVIDELHESYTRLESSCHVTLVKKDNNLTHVLSALHRINQEVNNLEAQRIDQDELDDLSRESVALITRLRDVIQHKCDLSAGITLDGFLSMFSDSLGAFEVSSDAAERIISITRNVFSFNTKMFVNEQALKRIRMGHLKGNRSRIALYYEIDGDSHDTNPTLHDLFQLISAALYACALLTDTNYKRWINSAGQSNASSQNTPLGNFIEAANSVVSEVRHIFDRTTDEELEIDHFFTYLQPKTVFTLAPLEELNHYNKGAKNVTLAFEIDLIKELPEAMLVRMLAGTHNKVICLSATSGFTHTKNGNVSRHFLNRYAQDLGYKIIERESADIDIMDQLRRQRARLRQVNFTRFDENGDCLTDILTTSKTFRKVYQDIQQQLIAELESYTRSPYKKRQIKRELEALLLASYDQKNSLILSLSSDFKHVFTRAYRRHTKSWRTRYHMVSRCDGQLGHRHDQIFEFSPFKGKHTLRLVFFDAPLAKITDIRQETYLCEPDMSLVFMSTYISAGTGLNYFVKYHDGNLNDAHALGLDVDFQRLILINSPFYSDVLKPSGTFDRLPNYITLLKHFADDNEIHLMRDLSVNFSEGENYRLLMAEHLTSLFKIIIQAVGRVERRDTKLHTDIFMPNEVLRNVAFQFASVKENKNNDMVLESMSLLNYCMMEEGQRLSGDNSFADPSHRDAFEQQMVADGLRIDTVHKRVLTENWIQHVRQGNIDYLAVCNLFRDPLSFTEPKKWLANLKRDPIFAANKQMMAIADKMFISPQQRQGTILLCHKRGPDGLTSSQRFALSDFAGGYREYQPQRYIFPQYNKYLVNNKDDPVKKIFNYYQDIQDRAFSEWIPHPAIVPLLKGNVGEAIFDAVLAHFKLSAMSEERVFSRLGTQVYELFDRFIEIDHTLLCIDVKNWASSLDNLPRAKKTVASSAKKIRYVNEQATLAERKVEEELRDTAFSKHYEHIKFIYLNTHYSNNPNNLMCEENVDHTVHYLNLFQANHQYEPAKDKQSSYFQHKSRLSRKIEIHPTLTQLLGVTP